MDGTTSGPPPVAVISPQFCVGYPLNITILRKVLTHTDFVVTDADANELLKTRAGQFLAVRDRHVLLDAAENPLITFQRKILSLSGRWKVFRGESSEEKDVIFSVKPHSSFFQWKTKLDVFLSSSSTEEEGRSPDFRIVCTSYNEKSCDIYAGNHIIAQMRKKSDPKSFFLGRQILEVTVNPFVDYAFVVTLLMILEEIHMQGSNN